MLEDDEPLLAFGSPGGSMIITTVLQILLDRLDLGSTLPDAIAAPRASQRNTMTTVAEPAFVSSPLGQQLAGWGLPFSRVRFARAKRLGRLVIHRDCIARWASALDHLGYDKRAADRPDNHLDRVPHTNHLRGLHTFAVHVYSPPKDGLGRRATRLEDARCPEPLIDPHAIHGAMIAVARDFSC